MPKQRSNVITSFYEVIYTFGSEESLRSVCKSQGCQSGEVSPDETPPQAEQGPCPQHGGEGEFVLLPCTWPKRFVHFNVIVQIKRRKRDINREH